LLAVKGQASSEPTLVRRTSEPYYVLEIPTPTGRRVGKARGLAALPLIAPHVTARRLRCRYHG
jgi:hypothetical protein